MSKLTSKDLIDSIASKTGSTKADAKRALEAVVETVSDALKAGDSVGLAGFGTFSVREDGERVGVKPGTAEKITIPATKRVKFKVADQLSKSIKG